MKFSFSSHTLLYAQFFYHLPHNSNGSLLEWLHSLFSPHNGLKVNHLQLTKIAYILWAIWNAQKRLIFDNKVFSPYVVWRQVITHFNALANLSMYDARSERGSSNRARKDCHWSPPSSNFVKLNFSGSRSARGVAGRGFVLSSFGNVLAAGAFHLGAVSINVAEILARWAGIIQTRRMGINKLHIEGGSKVIIDAHRFVVHTLWSIQKLKEDILSILKEFNEVWMSHIYREANRTVDAITKFSVSNVCNNVWLSGFLEWILQVVHTDGL